MKKVFMFLLILTVPGASFAAEVNDQFSIESGNAKLYVEVRGPGKDAPIILYVHGGPGNVALGMAPFRANVGRQLEKDFRVAYLHQRGAGKSSPVPDSAQTLSNHMDDLDRVVNFLTERYGRNKVHLVGHSVGGMLAASYADGHREKVEKLVLISTAMNFKSMLLDSYEVTLNWARKENNLDAIKDLTGIRLSFETQRDFGALSRWANQANGGVAGRFDMAKLIEDYQINRDYPDWQARQLSIFTALFPELRRIDLDGASFRIPALFVSGGRDTIVAERTVRRDYSTYGGRKQFLFLEGSHHLPFMDQPDLLASAILLFLSN